jgi:heme/copper-type cytochrome/quinol oxidase subunit 3
MSRFKALLLSFLTVWPLLYGVGFVVVWFVSFAAMQSGEMSGEFATGFFVVFAVHALTMLLGLAMMAFYCFHVFKNGDIEDDKQLIWFLVVFLTGPFGQMFYWYRFIWSTKAGRFDGSI